MSSRQQSIVAVTAVTLLLAVASFALRLYSKRITSARIWWDDYLIGVGLAFAIVPCAANFVGIRYGFGLHVDTLPAHYLSNYLICMYALLSGWISSLTSTKLGVLFFYWDVFSDRYFRWVVWGVGTFVIACFITGLFGFIFICVPLGGLWDASLHAKCIDHTAFFYATATLGMIGDMVILFLPLPIIVHLNMSWQKKLGVCLVFLTGGLVVIISAIRSGTLHQIDPLDVTWTNYHPALWTAAEATLAVASANLPLICPIITAIWSGRAGWSRLAGAPQQPQAGVAGAANPLQMFTPSNRIRTTTRIEVTVESGNGPTIGSEGAAGWEGSDPSEPCVVVECTAG